MRELEKTFRGKNVITALICFVIGALIFLFYCRDYLPIGKVQNLDNMNPAEITEGRGKITVYDVYDYYTYWTNSAGKEVTRDYFVTMGDDENFAYIGCELSGKKNDRAYQIMQELWEAEYNGLEVDYENLDHFVVKGRVKKISGDSLQYYNGFLDEVAQMYDISEEEMNQYFVPYVLEAAQVGDGDFMDYFIAFVGIVLIIASVGILINALFGDPLKEIKAYCKKSVDSDYQMALIERFYISATEKYDIRINDDYFMYTGGSSVIFCDTKDVLWFYKVVEKTSVNYIPTGKNYYVKFRLANGKSVQVKTNKKEVDEVLQYFMRLLPDSIVGHDASLEKTYTSDRIQMINEVKRRRGERLGGFDRQEMNSSENSSTTAEKPVNELDGWSNNWSDDLFTESASSSAESGEAIAFSKTETKTDINEEEKSNQEAMRDPMDLHLNFTRDGDSDNTTE